ncbi:MAG: hypothetical protein KAR40_00500 [Candidatus Sabulitectum sp.]|nr:hypothetical protein [Candidatus Sabulitectum sp.]
MVGEPFLIETDGLSTISISEMNAMELDGGAPLPRSVRYVPVPPGSEPHLEWTINAVGFTGWDRTLVMASAPILSGDGLQTIETFLPVEFPPEHTPVSFEVIHLLGTTVARISVSPFCYGTPAKYAKEINYSLSVRETSGDRSIEGTLLHSLCPETEVWWPYRQRSPESHFWGKPWARIGVKNTGFYCVTGEELEASGCTVTGVPSASLAMFAGPGEMFNPDDPGEEHQLASVSISVFDGGDGIFDLSDSLTFFGQDLWHWNFTADSLYRSFHRYDKTNTYWLTWGGDNGARIDQVTATPAGGSEIEEGVIPFGFEQEVFWERVENRTGWVWGFLNGEYASYFYLSAPFDSDHAIVRFLMVHGSASQNSYSVIAELEDAIILDTLTVDTVGNRCMEYFTINDVRITQGGNLLKVWDNHHDDAYFDYAEILLPVDLSVSAGYLVALSGYAPGIHSLRFGYVDTESHIFDVSDPFHPCELTGWTLDGSEAQMSLIMEGEISTFIAVNSFNYLSTESIEPAQPGRILGVSAPADVIITVPEVMLDGLAVLESVYAARGLSVSIVTYREVYDEFGQGVSDPGAVRSLVRWALDTWPDPPQALLLIGDGSNDPLGYSTGYESLAPVNVSAGFDSCKDSYFTTVHTGSEVPEIPVSRIPASTVNELLIASEKAAVLENRSILGPWANTVMLAADDEWSQYSYTEYRSTATCEFLTDSVIPASVNIVKLYEIEYPWPPGTTVEGVHPTKPEAAADFIEQLNRGVVYTSFFGHGSYDQMTNEKLFSSSMVSQLCNAPRYFLYNSFSCDNGFFDLSAGDCLAEILLFHPGGGASASVACTRGSTSSQNEVLSSEFLGRLHEGDFTIAEALWLSQLTIGYQKNFLYPVLGDGGITLPLAETAGYSAVPADTLSRGLVNTVDVSFPEESSFLFRCMESADTVVYVSPLSANFTIEYLRYGSELYAGILSTDEYGDAAVDFFVPLQADTGSFARTDATGRIRDELGTGYSWPIPLIDTGDHSDDSQGPEIELSFPDSRGGEIPSVYRNATMHAVLSDPSGICVLGNDAGSIIIGSVDGGYEDLTGLFTYHQGSYTTGSLNYTIPDLLPGTHEIRVVARDGMKNTGESVLSFNVLHGDAPLLEKTGVYPNPVRGRRAFIFTTSSAGTVGVTVFTISGRPVWKGETIVQNGAGQLVWNGMDSDGDSIAAGAYIYIIEFSCSSGSSSATDILVVSP